MAAIVWVNRIPQYIRVVHGAEDGDSSRRLIRYSRRLIVRIETLIGRDFVKRATEGGFDLAK